MHELARFYEARFDYPFREDSPRFCYWLAGTPRSGTNMVALELWRGGDLGAPLEYLNRRRTEGLWRRSGAATLADYLAFVRRVRTSANGVCGTKVFLTDLFGAGARFKEIWRGMRPRAIVLMRRKDKVAQAVSLYRAAFSDQWIAGGDAAADVPYDHREVDERVAFLTWQDEAWDKFLEGVEIPVARIWYEDLANDPAKVLKTLRRFLGVSETAESHVVLPTLDKQADRRSLELRALYLQEERCKGVASALGHSQP